MDTLYYKMSEEDFYNLSKVREYWESDGKTNVEGYSNCFSNLV